MATAKIAEPKKPDIELRLTYEEAQIVRLLAGRTAGGMTNSIFTALSDLVENPSNMILFWNKDAKVSNILIKKAIE